MDRSLAGCSLQGHTESDMVEVSSRTHTHTHRHTHTRKHIIKDFSGGSDGKESALNAGDPWFYPWVSLESGRSLEKGMATHSSILAWRIPWTEEPGGLQSVGS